MAHPESRPRPNASFEQPSRGGRDPQSAGGVLLAVPLSYVLDATLVALVVVEDSGEIQALPAVAAVLDGILRLFPFSIAAFLGAAAVAALANRSLPAWLGVAAAAIAVGALLADAMAFLVEGAAGIAFLAFMLMLAWIVAVSLRLFFPGAAPNRVSNRVG